MTAIRRHARWPMGVALVWLAAAAGRADQPVAGSPTPGTSAVSQTPRRWLESFALDREARDLLERAGSWDDDRTQLAVRTLLRLSLAPPEASEGWAAGAADWSGAAGLDGVAAEDRLVRVEGTAELVASVALPEGLVLPASTRGAAAGSVDLVRIRTPDGTAVDVLSLAAPRAWPRGRALAEPASVVGLPLAAGVGPAPPAAAEGLSAWPADAAAALLAAPRVAWRRADLAGRGGMDAGLYDTVVDGRKLVAEDADAFFALLAAAGRTAPGELAAAAGPPASIIPLIDPARHWFADHRGEPVAIKGQALRATRVEIDEPFRRRQTGLDHYWELFVFVATPPIEVGGKVMDRYPVVCCLRDLPAGMPTGPTIAEPVRVAAFAFKSYVWPLPAADGAAKQREAPLLIGGDVTWVKPAPAGRGGALDWIVAGLAVLFSLGVAAAVWNGSRKGRRRRESRERLGVVGAATNGSPGGESVDGGPPRLPPRGAG